MSFAVKFGEENEDAEFSYQGIWILILLMNSERKF